MEPEKYKNQRKFSLPYNINTKLHSFSQGMSSKSPMVATGTDWGSPDVSKENLSQLVKGNVVRGPNQSIVIKERVLNANESNNLDMSAQGHTRTDSNEGLIPQQFVAFKEKREENPNPMSPSVSKARQMQAKRMECANNRRHSLFVGPTFPNFQHPEQELSPHKLGISKKPSELLGQFQKLQNLVRTENSQNSVVRAEKVIHPPRPVAPRTPIVGNRSNFLFQNIQKRNEQPLSAGIGSSRFFLDSNKIGGKSKSPKASPEKNIQNINNNISNQNVLSLRSINTFTSSKESNSIRKQGTIREIEEEGMDIDNIDNIDNIDKIHKIDNIENKDINNISGEEQITVRENTDTLHGTEAPLQTKLTEQDLGEENINIEHNTVITTSTKRRGRFSSCIPCISSRKSHKIGEESWFFNKKEIQELSKMGVEDPIFIAKPIVRDNLSTLQGEERSKEMRRMWKDAFRKVVIMNKFEKGRMKSDKISTRCLIMPGFKFNTTWTIVVILLLFYTATVTPFVVAFVDKPSFQFMVFELCIDSLFFFDIIINFFTPYYDNNTLVTQKSKIAKNYIKGWFFIDLVACIPFHMLQQDSDAGKYNKLLRLLRVARLYRLLRLFRLVKITKMLKLGDHLKEKFTLAFKLNPGWVRLLKMFIGMLFFVHIFSCGWFMMAKLNEFSPDTWVVRYGYMDSNIWRQYLAAVYCIFQTITTVGYGDIVPITATEQVYYLLLMGFGVGLYSFAIGNISSIVSKLDHQKRKLQLQLSTLRDFGKKAKLPIALLIKIRNHIEHKHQDLMGSMNQEALLKDLPATLRAEVITYTHRKLLEKVKFFAGKDPEFLWQVLPKLKPLALREGEILFREGDYSEEVYFMLEGSVKMISRGGYLFKTYNGGSYFGEIELLQNVSRESSARAELDSEILLIEKEAFLDILDDFPEIKKEVVLLAEDRDARRLELIEAAEKYGYRLEDDQYQILEDEMNLNLFNEQYNAKNMEDGVKDADSYIEVVKRGSLKEGNEFTLGVTPRNRRSTVRGKSAFFDVGDFTSHRKKSNRGDKRGIKRKKGYGKRGSFIGPVDEYASDNSIKTEFSDIPEKNSSDDTSSSSDSSDSNSNSSSRSNSSTRNRKNKNKSKKKGRRDGELGEEKKDKDIGAFLESPTQTTAGLRIQVRKPSGLAETPSFKIAEDKSQTFQNSCGISFFPNPDNIRRKSQFAPNLEVKPTAEDASSIQSQTKSPDLNEVEMSSFQRENNNKSRINENEGVHLQPPKRPKYRRASAMEGGLGLKDRSLSPIQDMNKQRSLNTPETGYIYDKQKTNSSQTSNNKSAFTLNKSKLTHEKSPVKRESFSNLKEFNNLQTLFNTEETTSRHLPFRTPQIKARQFDLNERMLKPIQYVEIANNRRNQLGMVIPLNQVRESRPRKSLVGGQIIDIAKELPMPMHSPMPEAISPSPERPIITFRNLTQVTLPNDLHAHKLKLARQRLKEEI